MKITYWLQKPNFSKQGFVFWKPHMWTETETGRKAQTFFFVFLGITFYT